MSLSTKDLTNRVVVITGAGSGIGRELALACARRGARLALCDVNATGLEQTAVAVRANGVEVCTWIVDVSDAQQMTTFAEEVLQRFVGVDLLVNNAGIGVVAGLLETTPEDWERLIGINLMGVVHGNTAFVPSMIARGSGHVVNVSSAAGILANPALSAYSATKFAVFGHSEALRMELREHGIGVTAVCPGVINTAISTSSPIRGGNTDARRQKMAALYAKRGYTPDRVALNILRAVDGNKAVAPIAPEAHLMYGLSRAVPPLARWLSRQTAKFAV
ncbi:SDR family NAD(P)-dependent oxidoreductase [Nocardia sp. NPDC101769]|uniref:SDR family NAD(P)-dependent oxidoreductase n=1 Tax=Nocardia sp. NPDC101769 TaxID=3364333 RepID=UPI00381DDCAE